MSTNVLFISLFLSIVIGDTIFPPNLKGMPGRKYSEEIVTANGNHHVEYFYNSAYSHGHYIGVWGEVTVSAPHVGKGDSHSLAEISAQNNGNIVEVGWTVDIVTGSNRKPTLFVFHWINGNPTCYNGCGFVQVSNWIKPGMLLNASNVPHRIGLQVDRKGNWWVFFGNEWVGYFPQSLWTAKKTEFKQAHLVQWFGEVAAGSTRPKSQMGNGQFGHSHLETSHWGKLSTVTVDNRTHTPDISCCAQSCCVITNRGYYNVGKVTSSGFHFGGPGLV